MRSADPSPHTALATGLPPPDRPASRLPPLRPDAIDPRLSHAVFCDRTRAARSTRAPAPYLLRSADPLPRGPCDRSPPPDRPAPPAPRLMRPDSIRPAPPALRPLRPDATDPRLPHAARSPLRQDAGRPVELRTRLRRHSTRAAPPNVIGRRTSRSIRAAPRLPRLRPLQPHPVRPVARRLSPPA